MSLSVTPRAILTPTAVARIALGRAAVAALSIARPALAGPVPAPVLVATLVAVVAVVLVCAFGVVHEAEHLAHRLGDPYGSLVLTLSIVLIEVVLIAAVMLGPGEHPTIARDSVMAVSMIILNAVVGLSLLVGGLRHDGLAVNRTGASAYLALLVALSTLALALPAVIGRDGAMTTVQQVPIMVITLVLYAVFLLRQTGAQAADFREVDVRMPAAPIRRPVTAILREHRVEIGLRAAVLVVTVLPIVLLSHDLASLLDDGLARVGAPTAVSGLLIAVIVFLPESITSVRAAARGQLQRVSNLCHGALVSTVGLTIPAVLAIGLLTGQTVVLGESPANLLLLGASLLLTIVTFASPRITATHGLAHLAPFGVYLVTVVT